MRRPLVTRWAVAVVVAVAAVAASGHAQEAARSVGSGGGQLERLVGLARDLVQRNPGSAEAHLQLAVALHRLNDAAPDGGRRLPEAEAAYRSAIRLASPAAAAAVAAVRANLAALLLSANRVDDALAETDASIEAYRRVGAGPAALAPALFNRGKALSAGGRLAEAEAAYLEAARAARGADLSTYGKALAAMQAPPAADVASAAKVARRGRRLMADRPGLEFLAELERAWPAEDPIGGQAEAGGSHGVDDSGSSGESGGGAAAAAAAAGKRKRKAGGAAVKASGRGVPSGGGGGAGRNSSSWIAEGDAVDLSWLHFAVHKAAAARGHLDAAWAHLEAGNRLMASTVRYNASRDRHAMRQIMEVFPGPFDGRFGHADSGGAVFVVGAPRSGSTLVEQMLGSHSKVFAAGEDTLLAPLASEMQAALTAPDANADAGAVAAAFGERYLREMRARAPGVAEGGPEPDYVVDKMLMNLWRVGHILMMLPHACIIHAARHPLDAGLSCYAQPFAPGAMPWAWDLETIGEQLDMTWTLATHWASAAPGRVHTLLYEDLVAHPEAAIRKALAFCGLEFEPAVLDFHKPSPGAAARGVHTASQAQVRRPLYGGAVGRWRGYSERLAPLRAKLGGWVEAYEELLAQTEARRRREAGGGDAGGGSGSSGGGDAVGGATPANVASPSPDDGSGSHGGGASGGHGGGGASGGRVDADGLGEGAGGALRGLSVPPALKDEL